MRRGHLWLLLVVALGVVFGYWWSRRAAPVPPAAPAATARPAPRPATLPATPKPEVAIQDRKTIDFSSGKPVVKDSTEDKAIIDRAKREMDEATKDITFGPTPPPKK